MSLAAVSTLASTETYQSDTDIETNQSDSDTEIYQSARHRVLGMLCTNEPAGQ